MWVPGRMTLAAFLYEGILEETSEYVHIAFQLLVFEPFFNSAPVLWS